MVVVVEAAKAAVEIAGGSIYNQFPNSIIQIVYFHTIVTMGLGAWLIRLLFVNVRTLFSWRYVFISTSRGRVVLGK